MAGHNSRSLTVDWDSVTIADVQSKAFTVNAEPIDVTTDDDAGWRTLLSTPGVRSIEVTVSGIADSEAVLADIFAASDLDQTLTMDLPSSLASPGNFTGTFFVSSFEYNGGSPDGAVEFSATFMSSGAVTYTASSA